MDKGVSEKTYLISLRKNLFNFASEKTYLISLRKNLYKVSLGKIFANLLKVVPEKMFGYPNKRKEIKMKCYEVTMENLEIQVVYAFTARSAMKQAESITYLTALTARKLDGNKQNKR